MSVLSSGDPVSGGCHRRPLGREDTPAPWSMATAGSDSATHNITATHSNSKEPEEPPMSAMGTASG
jgi:hypothetical protein